MSLVYVKQIISLGQEINLIKIDKQRGEKKNSWYDADVLGLGVVCHNCATRVQISPTVTTSESSRE